MANIETDDESISENFSTNEGHSSLAHNAGHAQVDGDEFDFLDDDYASHVQAGAVRFSDETKKIRRVLFSIAP